MQYKMIRKPNIIAIFELEKLEPEYVGENTVKEYRNFDTMGLRFCVITNIHFY